MPEATELLHSNLLEVFGERDPQRRWAAIWRTYSEDMTFTDPDGDFVGWQALSYRAQELLDGASPGDVFEEPSAAGNQVGTTGARESARPRSPAHLCTASLAETPKRPARRVADAYLGVKGSRVQIPPSRRKSEG